MSNSTDSAYCSHCKKTSRPYMVGLAMYCPECGDPIFHVKETVVKPATSKPFKLYDKKGNFLCAFHDEQQARERVSLLAFNGVTAKLVTE